MNKKKAQTGYKTIMIWALIIAIGIILLIIIGKTGGFGQEMWAKIKESFNFV